MIVSGIGFLGAGAILHERGGVQGLTTAKFMGNGGNWYGSGSGDDSHVGGNHRFGFCGASLRADR